MAIQVTKTKEGTFRVGEKVVTKRDFYWIITGFRFVGNILYFSVRPEKYPKNITEFPYLISDSPQFFKIEKEQKEQARGSMKSITSNGVTFTVGRRVESVYSGLTYEITGISKATLSLLRDNRINSYCLKFGAVNRFKLKPREIVYRGSKLSGTEQKIESKEQTKIIKCNLTEYKRCVKCQANPLRRNCECLGPIKIRPSTTPAQPESQMIARKGWDNIIFEKQHAYLHMDSETIVFRKVMGSEPRRWYWRSDYHPTTGKRKHLFASPDNDVLELMKDIEDFLAKGDSWLGN